MESYLSMSERYQKLRRRMHQASRAVGVSACSGAVTLFAAGIEVGASAPNLVLRGTCDVVLGSLFTLVGSGFAYALYEGQAEDLEAVLNAHTTARLQNYGATADGQELIADLALIARLSGRPEAWEPEGSE